MTIDERNNGYECTYCGRLRDLDGDMCECGKGIGYVNTSNDSSFYWGDVNNIDNILEHKRPKKWRG